jgi:predicted RNase H-like HicB family nuclease
LTVEEALENLKEATELFLEDETDKNIESHSYFLTNLSLQNG